MNRFWFLVLVFLPLSFAHAQFQFAGNAQVQLNGCFLLTQNTQGQTGQVWSDAAINLNEPFDIAATLNFGNNGSGGEGIAFMLQDAGNNITSLAFSSLGYGGLSPSMAVEFDTFRDSALADPIYDHVALIRDGDSDHNTSNTIISPATLPVPNVKDGMDHSFRAFWDPGTQELEIYFDCSLVLSYTGDISTTFLGGSNTAFWGFTAGTKSTDTLAVNEHSICMEFTSPLQALQDSGICRNDTVPLDAFGGSTYAWSPSSGLNASNQQQVLAIPQNTTTYTVTVTDNCGLTRTDDVLITVDTLTPVYPLVTDVECFGLCDGTGTFTGNDPLTYLWGDGTTGPINNSLCAGTDTITLTDTINGCSDTVQINIADAVPFGLDPLPLGASQTICIGETISFSATGFGGSLGTPTIVWRTGSGTQITNVPQLQVAPTTTTVYVAEAQDPVFDCPVVQDTFTVFVNPPLTVSALNKNQVICKDDSASLSSIASGADGGPYVSRWYTLIDGTVANGTADGTPTIPAGITPDSSIQVYLEVFSANCHPATIVYDTIEIEVQNILPPEFALTFSDSNLCPGAVTIAQMENYNPEYEYLLEWGDGTSDSIVSENGALHNYQGSRCFDLTVTVSSAICPNRVRNFPCRVETYEEPFADYNFFPNDISRINPKVTLVDRSKFSDSQEWYVDGNLIMDQGFSQFDYYFPDSGSFAVMQIATNEFGCRDTVVSTIEVRDDLVTFYVPKAFTPNDDKKNDIFKPESNQEVVNGYYLRIFDRWGNMVWETREQGEGWDGKINGKIANKTQFFYNIQFREFNGVLQEYTGYFQLLR